jgi:hypothetical protein
MAQVIRLYATDWGLFAQSHAASSSQKDQPAGPFFRREGRIPMLFVFAGSPDAGYRPPLRRNELKG